MNLYRPFSEQMHEAAIAQMPIIADAITIGLANVFMPHILQKNSYFPR